MVSDQPNSRRAQEMWPVRVDGACVALGYSESRIPDAINPGVLVQATFQHHGRCYRISKWYPEPGRQMLTAPVRRSISGVIRAFVGKIMTEQQRALARANRALVHSAARKMRSGFLDYDDAVSEGNIALCRASRLFDPSRGFQFSTYAMHAIFRSLSRRRKTEYQKLGLAHREATCEDFIETVCDDTDTVADASQSEDGARVRAAVLKLPLRMQYIIQQRFYGDRTLEQVGRTIGASKERVRQLQVQAMDLLRELLVEEGTP